jgi:hypothetical protein
MNQNVLDALEDVEVEFLRHHAQMALGAREIFIDIHAIYPHRTCGLVDQ